MMRKGYKGNKKSSSGFVEKVRIKRGFVRKTCITSHSWGMNEQALQILL